MASRGRARTHTYTSFNLVRSLELTFLPVSFAIDSACAKAGRSFSRRRRVLHAQDGSSLLLLPGIWEALDRGYKCSSGADEIDFSVASSTQAGLVGSRLPRRASSRSLPLSRLNSETFPSFAPHPTCFQRRESLDPESVKGGVPADQSAPAPPSIPPVTDAPNLP